MMIVYVFTIVKRRNFLFNSLLFCTGSTIAKNLMQYNIQPLDATKLK